MSASRIGKGGSFRGLKAHLPLFSDSEHRHDRGWPHASGGDAEPERKPQWKTDGIFHFRHDEEDEG
jgi:hypothetical protein